MAAQRIAESWRYLWGKTGKSATLGKVVDYGFTTSEELKIESVENGDKKDKQEIIML